MNRATIIGNLGADLETRTTQGGSVIGNLRVATRERVKKGDEWVDHTEWHRVTLFGKTAENAQKYLKKGSQVAVEGKIRTNKYTDKEGVERYSTEIVADTIEFLGPREGRADERDIPDARPKNSKKPVEDDSDIPF